MITNEQILEKLRKAIDRNHGAWSEKNGIARQNVNAVLHGRRDMAPQIAGALGYRKVIMWQPINTDV